MSGNHHVPATLTPWKSSQQPLGRRPFGPTKFVDVVTKAKISHLPEME